VLTNKHTKGHIHNLGGGNNVLTAYSFCDFIIIGKRGKAPICRQTE